MVVFREKLRWDIKSTDKRGGTKENRINKGGGTPLPSEPLRICERVHHSCPLLSFTPRLPAHHASFLASTFPYLVASFFSYCCCCCDCSAPFSPAPARFVFASPSFFSPSSLGVVAVVPLDT